MTDYKKLCQGILNMYQLLDSHYGGFNDDANKAIDHIIEELPEDATAMLRAIRDGKLVVCDGKPFLWMCQPEPNRIGTCFPDKEGAFPVYRTPPEGV